MRIYIALLCLMVLSGCAANTIYRGCKQIGEDSNGKPLYDSCEKLR